MQGEALMRFEIKPPYDGIDRIRFNGSFSTGKPVPPLVVIK